jgi:hypothetical protein
LFLGGEFFYRVRRAGTQSEFSSRVKLVLGMVGLLGTVALVLILNRARYQFFDDGSHYPYVRGDTLVLPTLDWSLRAPVAFLTVPVGLIESVALIILGAKGRRQTGSTGKAAVAGRAAKALGLGPIQTQALVHVYQHQSITMEELQGLCPEVDRCALEQELRAMVKLGLVVDKGDRFIMT